MKIYTQVEYQWDAATEAYVVTRNEHVNYTGALALCSKGGGGSSGQRDATDEERALWSAQAQALQGMTNASMPALQTGMGNLSTMANESMDGTFSQRLRDQAGADVNVALGTSANDALRNLASRGGSFDPTTGRGADTAAQWGLGAAKQRAGAMNLATMGAEDVKWQRNAALTGLASGQGSSAVSGMGQLSSQIGQNRQAGMAADAQESAGWGTAAGTLLAASTKPKGFANGGLAQFPRVNRDWKPISISAGSKNSETEGGGSIVPLVSQGLMADKFLNDGKGLQALKDGVGGMGGPGAAPFAQAANDYGLAASTAEGATLAEGAGAGNAYAAETLAADAALAGEAAAGGAGLGGTIGAALPWVGGAMLVASLLGDEFADGGQVKQRRGLRRIMVEGGKVEGPGTSTSDSIPALLSDGEYVLNAEAVKLMGKEKLDKINQRGLARRSEARS